ncbi:shikimate 5-dehydrogenase [Candidatus Blochmanniella floridana]|uniref:Shikimate dehydrogenase (NADP(+)) n=1 Tax=Blochmanniella floridana TaxID=203907 RepID=AROE_BLOFL|nr:RecName: Full=Shikimate dehydrogenase (NADP(+)); Short=SDH [Candidatus Blochmannia floridanus]CAD83736.1 shikimate 5-dehydrogenase [Candidatus Blochmannia floridanus]
MSSFAIFGNPVSHSKSPKIYSMFANEFGMCGEYDLKVASDDNFYNLLYQFFDMGGFGANITVPFKKRAFLLCDNLTDRSILSSTVNTIKKQLDGTLLGDNTDGIGLINDLKRLNWISIDNAFIDMTCNNIQETANILLIGSGGAAQSIIPVLLDIKKCCVNIINRTFFNAQRLVQYYHSIGRQNISCIDLNNLLCEKNACKKYDLIINASSSSMNNDLPCISSFLITPFTKCYDLFYGNQDTIFVKWCKKNGSNYCVDGLGMLIEQAAYAFYLWHGKKPSVPIVLNAFRSELCK